MFSLRREGQRWGSEGRELALTSWSSAKSSGKATPRPGDQAGLIADTGLLFPGKDAVGTIQVEPHLLGGFSAMTW